MALDGLIDSFRNLSTSVEAAVAKVVSYQSQRLPFFISALGRMGEQSLSSDYIREDNNCSSILYSVQSIYSTLCVSYRARLHELYLLLVLSLGVLFFMIILGSIFAVQLISLKDVS